MTPVLFSSAWIDACAHAINHNEAYRRAAANWRLKRQRRKNDKAWACQLAMAVPWLLLCAWAAVGAMPGCITPAHQP